MEFGDRRKGCKLGLVLRIGKFKERPTPRAPLLGGILKNKFRTIRVKSLYLATCTMSLSSSAFCLC